MLCYMHTYVCCVRAASDSDENDVPSHPTKPSADVSAASNFSSKLHGARIVKYNFLDLSKQAIFVLAYNCDVYM